MRIPCLPRILGAAVLLSLVAPDIARADSLRSAREDCYAEFDDDMSDADPDSCDDYVDAAKRTGDSSELFTAYSIRSVLWQAKGELEAAMRDADLAIEAEPGADYGHGWRAVLTGFGGDYQAALLELDALERKVPQKDFYGDMALFEYLVGSSARSVELFRAAMHAAEVDKTPERAIQFGFQAALIEYEMKGGDVAPLKAFDVPVEGNGMVRFLHEFYVENKPDANAMVFLRLAREKGKDATCGVYFAIGHRNAVVGNGVSAKPALKTPRIVA